SGASGGFLPAQKARPAMQLAPAFSTPLAESAVPPLDAAVLRRSRLIDVFLDSDDAVLAGMDARTCAWALLQFSCALAGAVVLGERLVAVAHTHPHAPVAGAGSAPRAPVTQVLWS